MNPEQPTANSRLRKWLAKSERKGEEIFVRRAPVQIPEGLAHVIVAITPWLVVCLLLLSFPLLFLALTVGTSIGFGAGGFKPLYYLSVLVFLAITILSVMAVPALLNREAKGWRLIYCAVLVNIAFSIVRWLGEPQAYYSLFWSLVLSAMALYVLFQVRHYYR